MHCTLSSFESHFFLHYHIRHVMIGGNALHYFSTVFSIVLLVLLSFSCCSSFVIAFYFYSNVKLLTICLYRCEQAHGNFFTDMFQIFSTIGVHERQQSASLAFSNFGAAHRCVITCLLYCVFVL